MPIDYRILKLYTVKTSKQNDFGLKLGLGLSSILHKDQSPNE
jgi:hypothetical protein